ncbi:GNAT family N-acetyltransferase [Roseovarius atlanticus]|uniref:GNAT family N-acetyltransferase n=1 Tax=Roseovarius atlanticus TaxID=1641875 RepID=UPI000A70A123|nr:GNAT family N-acetyltransferase [Roseovarius atlanticus]
MYEFRNLCDSKATNEEIDAFVNLVGAGGAVDEYYVRLGIVRPGVRIVFAELDGQAVGVDALKRPSIQYRTGLQSAVRADFPLADDEYPYELGYVSVSPNYSRQGLARTLVAEVLRLADGSGVFATTSNLAMKDGLLPSFEFVLAGNSRRNGSGDVLHLLVLKHRKGDE